MVRLRELFGIFLQIGAFTLGGGYAMLSMVEMQIVTKKKYIPKDEFWNLIAVIQTLPGVFAINTALYNARTFRITAAAGTELAGPYSCGTCKRGRVPSFIPA